MGFRLATALRNALANAVTTLTDAGSGAGKILIYTGAQPTNPNTAASGTLLATFTLADPSFGAASAGTITLQGTPLSTTGVAAGTAGWFRMLDSADNAVADGTVSATGGGGQIELNTTTVSIGLALQITSGTITMPLGS